MFAFLKYYTQTTDTVFFGEGENICRNFFQLNFYENNLTFERNYDIDTHNEV